MMVTGAVIDGGDEAPKGAALVLDVALFALMIATCLAAAWSSFCLGIKRYHDLGKPGVWVLIQFVPAIGGLWYLIEAGFMRGTAGPNCYGADPLGFASDAPHGLSADVA